MGRYAVLSNKDNSVADVVDWDGSEPVERERDTTLMKLADDQEPEVGDIWNGTFFTAAPPPPEEPAEEDPYAAPKGKKKGKKEDDFA